MLNDVQFEILDFIYEYSPVTHIDILNRLDGDLTRGSKVCEELRALAASGYIRDDGAYRLTDSGRAKRRELLTAATQLEELSRIADAAEEQAALAKAEAEAAKVDAQKAARRSWVAIGISVIAIIVDVVMRFAAG